MDEFKRRAFRENHPGVAFPEFYTLKTEEASAIRRTLTEKLGIPIDSDPLTLVRRLLEVETPIGGFDARSDTFNLADAIRGAGIQAPSQVLVNWYRFDRIDQFALKDLIDYFTDIWYPSTDDIDIFDRSCAWTLSIMHYGAVQMVHFPLLMNR
jgi:hypothetical protein